MIHHNNNGEHKKLKLTTFNAAEFKSSATIQVDGKLTFSLAAIKLMGLAAGNFLVVATDDMHNIYVWPEPTSENGGFKLNKHGDILSVNLKALLCKLKIDFTKPKKMHIHITHNDNEIIYKIS